VLAGTLVETTEDALARLEVTLDLTENLYKRGSGKVKKTDFLKHKMIVESIRSMLADIKGRRESALVALTNTLGLS
jgi:outer membrane protein TolC